MMLLAFLTLVLLGLGLRYQSFLLLLCACMGFIGLGLTADGEYVQIVSGLAAAVSGLLSFGVALRGRA